MVFVRSDGSAVACGYNGHGQCDVPGLLAGVQHVAVAAGWHGAVSIRSDGSAVAFGHDGAGRCNVPELLAGRQCALWLQGLATQTSSGVTVQRWHVEAVPLANAMCQSSL